VGCVGPNQFPTRPAANKLLRRRMLYATLQLPALVFDNHFVIRPPPCTITVSSAPNAASTPLDILISPRRPDALDHAGGQTKTASLSQWDEVTYGASGSSVNTTVASSLSESQRRVYSWIVPFRPARVPQSTDRPTLTIRSTSPDTRRPNPSQRRVA
jgi:hypothetical protein